jgi:hypothetical protein
MSMPEGRRGYQDCHNINVHQSDPSVELYPTTTHYLGVRYIPLERPCFIYSISINCSRRSALPVLAEIETEFSSHSATHPSILSFQMLQPLQAFFEDLQLLSPALSIGFCNVRFSSNVFNHCVIEFVNNITDK